MLHNYLSLLQKIFGSFAGKGSVNLLDYILAIFYTFILLVSIFIVISIVSGLFIGPKKVYNITVVKQKNILWNLVMSQMYLNNNVSDTMVLSQTRKVQNFVLYYWVGIIFIYIPFALPTALLIIDAILSIF